MRRRKRDMYLDTHYKRNRIAAAIILAALCMTIGFMAALVLDAVAEGAAGQVDQKAAWAVQWSKERGEYPF